MLKTLLLLLNLFPFLIFGQSKRDTIFKRDTMVVRYFKNSEKLLSEHTYLNGKPISVKKWNYYKESYSYKLHYLKDVNPRIYYKQEFHLNGKLRIQSSLSDNKNNGSYKTYYQNGQNQCNCNYILGKRDGLQIIHFDNGQIWMQIIYKDDKPWKVLANFDKAGNALEKGTLNNGNGTLYIYDENASLLKIEYYKDGKIEKMDKKVKKLIFETTYYKKIP